MSLLLAYLQKPRTKRVLSLKPGDQGFSLIELVVVVAVLAILAAVAIPAFTSINDKAAVAAAQNTLTQIVKECAVKKANGEAESFLPPNLNSYKVTKPALATGATQLTCAGASNIIELTAANDGDATAPAFDNTVIPKTINVNVVTGAKGCEAGTTDTDNRYCSAAGTW